MKLFRIHHLRPALLWALLLALPASEPAFSQESDTDGKTVEKAPAQPAKIDPQIRVTSISGKEICPFDCDGKSVRVVVVVFITTDCPIANRYAPEIERIRSDYEEKGVKMTLIQVDPDLSEKAAGDHAVEYSLKAPVVIDRKHRLVAATGARVTPEAVVIDRSGLIRYRGRIDDQFADYGERRREAKTHDLRNAITAVLEGRTVETPETVPIGCFISELP